MIKFKSNKKATFLKYFGVDIKPTLDKDTNTVLWLVNESENKYMDAIQDYIDCTRGYREVYLDYCKWLDTEREIRDLIYKSKEKKER
ncbi:MAG: hypothetical protein RSE41_06115 [Clostridia bacterium]